MQTKGHGGSSAGLSDEELATVVAAFRAGEQIYRSMGSPLYAALCVGAADDPKILELAGNAEETARPIHLFTCVHHLLIQDPGDPLSRYFPTLAENPAPPEKAFPEFARFCGEYQEAILHLLQTHTVQMTYADRCRAVLPPIWCVAQQAGEPLNLVEIGCSAGVLLTLDKYAYEYEGRERIGAVDAPVTLVGELHGGPAVGIPKIGTRTGIDLHVVDVKSEQQRRWVLASTFPELCEQQERLASALDVVGKTDIQFLEGDGLALLPQVLADTPSPLCVFHSACLMYWSPPAKAALDELLKDASRNRDIFRVGLEPSEKFDTWQQGRTDKPEQPQNARRITGEIVISRYHGGSVDRRVVAYNNRADFGSVEWLDVNAGAFAGTDKVSEKG